MYVECVLIFLYPSIHIPQNNPAFVILGDLTYHITNKGKSKPFHRVG